MDKICKWCNKTYTTEGKSYCSKKCYKSYLSSSMRVDRVERTCKWCKKKYKTKPATNKYYCSKKCSTEEFASMYVKRICFTCGKEYSIPPSDAKHQKGKTYCSRKCTRKQVPENEIVNDYLSGSTSCEIADKFGANQWTICKILHRNNVEMRPGAIEKCYIATDRKSDLSEFHKQIIDGLILSDAYIKRPALASIFHLTTIEKEFADHVRNILPMSWHKTRIRESRLSWIVDRWCSAKTSYNIYTRSDLSLNEFRDKWYPTGKKIVPQSLILTPTIVKYWFYGDGTSSWQKGSTRSVVTLCTDGFSVEECESLNEKLKKDANITGFNITMTRRHHPTLRSTKTDVINSFFDYIGEPDVSCFAYKWKRSRKRAKI